MKLVLIRNILCVIALFLTSQTYAASYKLPSANESIIGKLQHVPAGTGDTVVTIAERYNMGYNSIRSANPTLDLARGFSSGTSILVPTQHLLPRLARRGIIINLPEMRLYYFPEGSSSVYTYPIGIGRIGKTIPIENTAITYKKIDPNWIPTEDIREFNRAQGVILPRVMPPGPDNPLGNYAIYLRLPTYLIHSTIFPDSIGRRASFGCIRMYEPDIKEFFPSVTRGIPVAIINTPVKVDWQSDRLFIEAHEPLEEHHGNYDASLPGMVNTIHNASKSQLALIDWQLVSYIDKERDGIPHEIGVKIAR